MPSRINFFLLGIAVLSIVSLVCAAVAWSRISQLSLPFPTILPALNILLPLLTALFIPLFRRLVAQAKQRTIRFVLPYLAQASTLLPFALFILSLVYATPGDIQSCSIDRHWLRMFEAKNERAIRSIQTALQCCGLNSMHDRAWPFPSRGVDARACERAQGYTVACGQQWRHEETVAATLVAVASFLNWLVMLLTVINSSQEEGRIRLPAWSTVPRLIEDDSNAVEARTNETEDEERPEQQRIWEGSHE